MIKEKLFLRVLVISITISLVFINGNINEINFGINNLVIYKPALPSNQDGSIYLKVKTIDSVKIVPGLLHDSLYSNRIEFFDVTEDDPDYKPWNVLELKVTINIDMFAFTTLPQFILKGKELIQQSPVYRLVK